jgi:2-polyprenyl-6-methoxyphenol hydroxylase-like FAD-dependent oxidoreductase
MLLAVMLARKGIKTHILDKGETYASSPRAAHYAPPAVHYLHKAGVADEAATVGYRPERMSWRKVDGSVIAGLDLSLYDSPERLICLPIDLLLKVLYSHVEKYGDMITVSWNHEVVDVGQDEQSAWVDVKTPEGEKRIKGDYLVGCDGGTSTVRRKTFGRNFPGHTWETQLVATNVRSLSSSVIQ